MLERGRTELAIVHYFKKNVQPELLIFYLLWPIIVSPKVVQSFIIIAILFVLLRKHKLYFDSLSYFLIAFICIYLYSIIYNLIIHDFEITRILATFNTFSLWLFALFFYLIYKTVSWDIENIKKLTFYNYGILIILCIMSLIISTLTHSQEFTILTGNLYYKEWFGSKEVMRFVAFMEYPNLIIMFFMFFYPLYLMHLFHYKHKPLKIFLTILGILPVLMTFSRSGYVVIFTFLIVAGIYFAYRKLSISLFIAIVSFTLSIALLTVVYTNFSEEVQIIMQELFSAREGSNDSRSFLMMESIKVALSNSPLIGMGVKVTSAIGYPLGSHSTFVGMFYKTGFVGLLMGCLLFLTIQLKLLFNKGDLAKATMKFSILLMLPLFIVEDIDGSNWLMVYYFLFVSLLLNQWKDKLPKEERGIRGVNFYKQGGKYAKAIGKRAVSRNPR